MLILYHPHCWPPYRAFAHSCDGLLAGIVGSRVVVASVSQDCPKATGPFRNMKFRNQIFKQCLIGFRGDGRKNHTEKLSIDL